MITKRIVIKGLVQGIGYRPFVAELAEKLNIGGWVRNTDGIVTILATGRQEVLDQFVLRLQTDAPVGARVDKVLCEEVREDACEETGRNAGMQDARDVFRIVGSEDAISGNGFPLIPADLPTCKRCERELFDPANRRFHHPFISCTSCGPRYSIIEDLPYDRERITMKKFPMCEACFEEYTAKGNIRRHAQTIACLDCGPKLVWEELTAACTRDTETAKADGTAGASRLIRDGGIIAVKDIGGYHLACSPFSENAVQALRRLKGREHKPFAVMFMDVEQVKEYCICNPLEEEQLLSAPRPIVLLKRRRGQTQESNDWSFACGNSPDIGAMLPCNPVQILLIRECGPLIMTSGNASGDLLCIDDAHMRSWLLERRGEVDAALGILSHDRPILTPLDDSIVRIVRGRRQFIRRARGFVPEPIEAAFLKEADPAGRGTILAMGGDLKATFAYGGQKKAYMCQYLGDLAEESCYHEYEKQLSRMQQLFHFMPQRIVADLHPGYRTHLLAERLAKRDNLPLQMVQHHKAHVASVVAEHDLKGSVLGFAFDGTGYGEDGTIWGGEAFLWDGRSMERIAHLRPVSLIGGDEGARNADTICYGYMASLTEEIRTQMAEHPKLFPWMEPAKQQLVSRAIERKINTVQSSSMGRLFDAVSAFLDICHYNSYEGEAAIELENLAAAAHEAYPLHVDAASGGTEALFLEMLMALQRGISRASLARGFIYAVSDYIIEVCRSYPDVKQVALGGGTFLNRILLERTIDVLSGEGYQVYMNEKLPSGDGGICLGQLFLAAAE